MKQVQVGFVAKRTEDGGFACDRPILREVSDHELGASGLTKVEERALRRAANSVFAELVKDNPLFAK